MKTPKARKTTAKASQPDAFTVLFQALTEIKQLGGITAEAAIASRALEAVKAAKPSPSPLLPALSAVTARLETVLRHHGATDAQIAAHPDLCAAREVMALNTEAAALSIPPALLVALRDLLNSEDSEGCSEGYTVVSSAPIAKIRELIRFA